MLVGLEKTLKTNFTRVSLVIHVIYIYKLLSEIVKEKRKTQELHTCYVLLLIQKLIKKQSIFPASSNSLLLTCLSSVGVVWIWTEYFVFRQTKILIPLLSQGRGEVRIYTAE